MTKPEISWREGTTHLANSPQVFMDRLACRK
jgi:hypothetical protein